MVRRDGRVVILDFGLMSDTRPGTAVADDRMAGTPAYLAPEQHAGADPSEASDWYAVGVTLYEALTGRLPFDGSWHELRARKSHSDPPPPACDRRRECPTISTRSVWDCCAAIPSGACRDASALDKLVDRGTRHQDTTSAASRARLKPSLSAARGQLAILSASFAAVREGRAAAVCVHGPSGIGKTALVQHFLDQLPHGDDAVVLRGRCYQHESVPYEALDGIIDSLSAYLRALPAAQAAALVPPEAGALARAFPVMRQVEAVARAARDETSGSGAIRAAPSGVLGAARAPDTDGTAARARAAHRRPALGRRGQHARARSPVAPTRPAAPPDGGLPADGRDRTKPFLQAFLQGGGTPSRTALLLEPMTEDETRDVMASLIPAEARLTAAERLALSREAGGNPFLLEQLAHYAAGHDARGSRSATLADMLQHRLHGLAGWSAAVPGGARRLRQTDAAARGLRGSRTRGRRTAARRHPPFGPSPATQRLRLAHRDVSRPPARDAGRTAVA